MRFYTLLAENFIIRQITIFVCKAVRYVEGVAGLFKFKAFIKNSGSGSLYNLRVDIKHGKNITIGDNTLIGPHCSLGALSPIVIGSFVRISRGVIIETAGLDLSAPPPYKHRSKPITIKDGVWIASNAIILGGVTIGENAIIGAGVVVTKDVAPNTIVVGQPVRVLENKIIRNNPDNSNLN